MSNLTKEIQIRAKTFCTEWYQGLFQGNLGEGGTVSVLNREQLTDIGHRFSALPRKCWTPLCTTRTGP